MGGANTPQRSRGSAAPAVRRSVPGRTVEDPIGVWGGCGKTLNLAAPHESDVFRCEQRRAGARGSGLGWAWDLFELPASCLERSFLPDANRRAGEGAVVWLRGEGEQRT